MTAGEAPSRPGCAKARSVLDWLPAESNGGSNVYRSYYQRPGCLGWTIIFIMATCLAYVPAAVVAMALPDADDSVLVVWVGFAYVVSVGLVMWGLARLLRWVSTTYRAVCPHCGVNTDPQFRVCRSCGRVKTA